MPGRTVSRTALWDTFTIVGEGDPPGASVQEIAAHGHARASSSTSRFDPGRVAAALDLGHEDKDANSRDVGRHQRRSNSTPFPPARVAIAVSNVTSATPARRATVSSSASVTCR